MSTNIRRITIDRCYLITNDIKILNSIKIFVLLCTCCRLRLCRTIIWIKIDFQYISIRFIHFKFSITGNSKTQYQIKSRRYRFLLTYCEKIESCELTMHKSLNLRILHHSTAQFQRVFMFLEIFYKLVASLDTKLMNQIFNNEVQTQSSDDRNRGTKISNKTGSSENSNWILLIVTKLINKMALESYKGNKQNITQLIKLNIT